MDIKWRIDLMKPEMIFILVKVYVASDLRRFGKRYRCKWQQL